MSYKAPREKYTCLLFGEGGSERNFLNALAEIENFKFHLSNWSFRIDSGHGGSPNCVLKKCNSSKTSVDDIILCFIDLDKLKEECGKSWEGEKKKLEEKYDHIKIIWQENDLEDEFRKVLGNKYKNKNKINKIAKRDIEKFVNSDFYKRILEPILEKEEELE